MSHYDISTARMAGKCSRILSNRRTSFITLRVQQDWASETDGQHKVYAREYGRPDRTDTRQRTMFFDDNEVRLALLP